MAGMTARENFWKAVNHEEPERIPIFWGGTNSSIVPSHYDALCRELGIKPARTPLGDFGTINLHPEVKQRLHSDVELALLLDIVELEPVETHRSRVLDARIRLEIEFRDLEDGGLLYRLELDTAKVRESLIAGAGGEEALDRNLSANGLVWPDVDELVLRIAAVNAFVDQRLLPRISVSMEEIEAAYQDLLVKEIAASDKSIPPLATVSGHLRQILVARKLNDEIERWVERASERQEVMRFSR